MDMVRSLSEQFEQRLTNLFAGYVDHFLKKYGENPAQNWKDKDMAITLLMAITAKTATLQHGATKTNEAVNILSIFSEHIMPILGEPVTSKQAVHPMLQVDALKFLNTFRHQVENTTKYAR